MKRQRPRARNRRRKPSGETRKADLRAKEERLAKQTLSAVIQDSRKPPREWIRSSGMPVAVLPERRVEPEQADGDRRRMEEIMGMIKPERDASLDEDFTQGKSPILLFPPPVAKKQLTRQRKRKQELHWTEYQKVQGIVKKVVIEEKVDSGTGIRLAGWAMHGGDPYAIVWEAEHKSDRNKLITFFRFSSVRELVKWATRRRKARGKKG